MKATYFILAILLLAGYKNNAQSPKKVCIAFYNTENLFDTLNDPLKSDDDFTPGGKQQWSSVRFCTKLDNLAKVIGSMNDSVGPDMLGLCEVENANALDALVKSPLLKKYGYTYILDEGPDERGIDVAFLYKPGSGKKITHSSYVIDTTGLKGDHTRNILLVNATLKNGSMLHILVNHWPSRREGQEASEFKRMYVARIARSICDSIMKAEKNAAILLVGDYNDMPDNMSIMGILAARTDSAALKDTDLYDLMYPLMKKGLGSYKYRGEWNMLDQMIVSKSIFDCRGKACYVKGSATIYKKDWMIETDPRYAGSPLRTFAGTKYLGGYSDHFPVLMYLELK
jgi:endonuclease/exonuclease/phosphatase family metal-dependent hydrolase